MFFARKTHVEVSLALGRSEGVEGFTPAPRWEARVHGNNARRDPGMFCFVGYVVSFQFKFESPTALR